MRRIAVFLTLFAFVLAPCSPASFSEPVPEAAGGVPLPVILGVASSILSIANQVKSLFGTGQNAEEEQFRKQVIARLDKIDGQLTDIQNKLDAINQRLDALQVHIDKQFEHQRVVDVLAVLQTIDHNYATWTKPGYSPSDPQYAAVSTPKHNLEILQDRVAALRAYPSYANFSTVALGMAYEHLILTNIFHRPPDDENARAGYLQYASFFKDAASVGPDRTGTVGQSWIAANADLAQLNAKYQSLPKPLLCAEGGNRCVPSNPTDWNWYYSVANVVEYHGDLLSGFQPVHVSADPEHDCLGVFWDGPGGNPEGVCHNNPPMYPRQRYCTGVAPSTLVNTLNSSCPLGHLHELAANDQTALQELSAALKSLRVYYVQAARWGGVPESRIAFFSPDAPVHPGIPHPGASTHGAIHRAVARR